MTTQPTTRPVRLIAELRAAGIEITRYNGGWSKRITGLDKSKANGYSLVGGFINDPAILPVGALVLDCDINGSRKNQRKSYIVARVTAEGLEVLAEAGDSRDWAISLWPAIESALAASVTTSEEPTGADAMAAKLEQARTDEARIAQLVARFGTDEERTAWARLSVRLQ